jgi:hypothetical protein
MWWHYDVMTMRMRSVQMPINKNQNVMQVVVIVVAVVALCVMCEM